MVCHYTALNPQYQSYTLKVIGEGTLKILLLSDIQSHTAILIIIEGQLQVFQQFSSSKLVIKTVESCYTALNYYENSAMLIDVA